MIPWYIPETPHPWFREIFRKELAQITLRSIWGCVCSSQNICVKFPLKQPWQQIRKCDEVDNWPYSMYLNLIAKLMDKIENFIIMNGIFATVKSFANCQWNLSIAEQLIFQFFSTIIWRCGPALSQCNYQIFFITWNICWTVCHTLFIVPKTFPLKIFSPTKLVVRGGAA